VQPRPSIDAASGTFVGQTVISHTGAHLCLRTSRPPARTARADASLFTSIHSPAGDLMRLDIVDRGVRCAHDNDGGHLRRS